MLTILRLNVQQFWKYEVLKVRYSVMQNLTRNLPEVYPVMKKWKKVLDEYAGKGKEKWVHIFSECTYVFDIWYCISI